MKRHVYIVTNNNNTVLYTGVTSDLKARIAQHKTKKYLQSFSARYNITKLVYYECFSSMVEAICQYPHSTPGISWHNY
jgi:putative endonuclease